MPRRKPEKIIPIILAAGSSSALPFPKALAPFGNKTALQLAIENCSLVGKCLVVLGSDAKRISPKVPRSAQIVINRKWRHGQLSSLQAALRQVPANAAFLIYPVDHPLLKRKTITQLVRAFRSRSKSHEIVMPRHQAAFGHPVIVSAALKLEFFAAPTAREVIYRDTKRIKVVPVKTPAIFQDFNSPKSYKKLAQKFLPE